jgi:multidrug efflux system outer membrane protein
MTLGQALKFAATASPDIQLEQAHIAQTEMFEDLAKADYYPHLSGSLTASGVGLRDVFALREPHYSYTYYSGIGTAEADLNWTLTDFGRTSSHVAAASRAIVNAQQTEQATRGQVAKATAAAFLIAVNDDEVLESRKTSLKNRERFALFAKALVEKGVKAGIDEVRARLNVEAAKHELARVESKAKEDRARLAILLGMEPSKLGPLAKATLPALENEDPTRAAQMAIKTRPEVQAAATDVEVREKNVEAAKAGYLPVLNFGLSGSFSLKRYDAFDDILPARNASAVLSLSFPILDPHVWHGVHRAEADAAFGRAREAKVKRDVTTESEIAVIQLQSARSVMARAKELATIAEGVLAVIEARYQAGISNPLELVDAEAADIEAKDALLQAQLRIDLATVDVLVATNRWTQLQK